MYISHTKEEIAIAFNGISLNAFLYIPEQPVGFVIFSHGSGSSRFSRRNNYVAEILCSHRIGSLLADLLTFEEDKLYQNRFDISLLTRRLTEVTKWALKDPRLEKLPFGYFGASTGAACAFNAAAHLGTLIKAVVSRGGRPDLADQDVPGRLALPVLLIVGSLDLPVIALNKKVFHKLTCPKKLTIIERASHLFEEPGTLEEVAEISSAWLANIFTGQGALN